jgi:hypothetical protein
MNYLFLIPITVMFFSCCGKKESNNNLPRYSDMGAAEDAGKAK